MTKITRREHLLGNPALLCFSPCSKYLMKHTTGTPDWLNTPALANQEHPNNGGSRQVCKKGWQQGWEPFSENLMACQFFLPCTKSTFIRCYVERLHPLREFTTFLRVNQFSTSESISSYPLLPRPNKSVKGCFLFWCFFSSFHFTDTKTVNTIWLLPAVILIHIDNRWQYDDTVWQAAFGDTCLISVLLQFPNATFCWTKLCNRQRKAIEEMFQIIKQTGNEWVNEKECECVCVYSMLRDKRSLLFLRWGCMREEVGDRHLDVQWMVYVCYFCLYNCSCFLKVVK